MPANSPTYYSDYDQRLRAALIKILEKHPEQYNELDFIQNVARILRQRESVRFTPASMRSIKNTN